IQVGIHQGEDSGTNKEKRQPSQGGEVLRMDQPPVHGFNGTCSLTEGEDFDVVVMSDVWCGYSFVPGGILIAVQRGAIIADFFDGPTVNFKSVGGIPTVSFSEGSCVIACQRVTVFANP